MIAKPQSLFEPDVIVDADFDVGAVVGCREIFKKSYNVVFLSEGLK